MPSPKVPSAGFFEIASSNLPRAWVSALAEMRVAPAALTLAMKDLETETKCAV
jgi:hypothetical protein